MSYPWEVSVANPLPDPFASVGMPPMDVVEEPDQDPAPSEGPAWSDPEDGPGTHYIDPSFRNELRKVINFEVKFSFRRNYRVIVPSPTDTVDNPPRVAWLYTWRLWNWVFASSSRKSLWTFFVPTRLP